MNFPMSARVRACGVAGLVAGAITTSVALSTPAASPTDHLSSARTSLTRSLAQESDSLSHISQLAAAEAGAESDAVSASGAPGVDAAIRANSSEGRFRLVARPAASRGARVALGPLQSAGSGLPTATGALVGAIFQWPVPGAVTGPFGERRGGSRHPGIDLEGSVGDPVRAAASGVVVLAGSAPSGYAGYGNLIGIDHGNGIVTLYAHLSRVGVQVGQPVSAGGLIGAIGMTGHTTGAHLHFELRLDGTISDPTPYLPPR